MHSKSNNRLKQLVPSKIKSGKILLLLLSLLPNLAAAIEYRSVSVPKAVLYDAPSAQAKKLFLLGQGYPLEVIVNLGEWVKVRDYQGGLNWVEAKQLSNQRMVIVTASQAELRQAADASASLLGKVEKDVVLELLEPASNGWVKVKHKDGLSGYVQTNVVWGF